ncbi:hypothetical protein PR001_g14775 [Phytophthora rubi]|uniref:Uncharacterized protein n=1 Tax=Phytophthora rubi TaxID=129364 RepID=A0A6A3L8R9_9STRA|nr:hypothetical protein PR001_g14775 [Phytophthora rubi]
MNTNPAVLRYIAIQLLVAHVVSYGGGCNAMAFCNGLSANVFAMTDRHTPLCCTEQNHTCEEGQTRVRLTRFSITINPFARLLS